jgi:hypothetical protein
MTVDDGGPLRLDAATATRLLDRRVDPADAPPGYAAVATVLLSAAAPPRPGDLAGESTALAAFGQPTRPTTPRSHSRPVRLLALVASGVVVLGGVAAATTGSLPAPAQSVARDAFGAVGVSIPTPASTTQAGAPPPPVVSHPSGTPRPTPPPTPTTRVPQDRARPARLAPTPVPPSTAGAPPVPAVVGRACQAYETGRIGPTGSREAVAGYEALARLAGGAAQISGYCHAGRDR